MGIAVNAPLQTSSLFRPATRLSSIGVSEILKITGLATNLKHQGKDVIIHGAGEPDFDTPAHIKDAAARAMHAGATKYTALGVRPVWRKRGLCSSSVRPTPNRPVTTVTKIPDVERLALPDVLPLAEFGRQSACRPHLSAAKGFIPVMEG